MNINPREELRGNLLAKRRAVDEQVQARASEAVVDQVARQLDNKLGGHKEFVAAYRPLGGEIDPTPALLALLALGWRAALPRCSATANASGTSDGYMDFCAWEPGDVLVSGAYGISEPATPPIDLSELAAVIVPGVGFSRNGDRIGHGVGFYDRFFARSAQHGYDPYRLGLAYDFQIVDLPAPEPWDVPVHCVITPSELIGS